ncbi:LLM class flavin-dependent oxidoreductase [Pseudonocardia xinjiangensis]|uniref:LLM class flavin-dependent oxidoreductase n=1 Tax=Pseudonocardia xinjiangensis TaxID=75289 RepID=UPI003D90D2FB
MTAPSIRPLNVDPDIVRLGLNTFGDVSTGPAGALLSHSETIRNVVIEGLHAETVGIDFFGIGEHHREDEPMGAPEIIMAAIAAQTRRIHIGSAVTVLSTDDPVRVYERFATLDAVSSGRAEIIIGRASSPEPYPLFGYQLDDYELLSEEKTELFAQLLTEKPVTWTGATRSSLDGQPVYPRTESGLRTWIGIGGSTSSVLRAAKYAMPMMIAIIGGPPARFRPLADLYRRVLAESGTAALPVGMHSPGHVADTDEQAFDEIWPHYMEKMQVVARERGFRVPTREQFRSEVGPQGSYYVGAPETVARKITTALRTIGAERFDLKYDMGGLPHPLLMRSIELYGSVVVPRVKELLADG